MDIDATRWSLDQSLAYALDRLLGLHSFHHEPFTHYTPLTEDDLRRVEAAVGAVIAAHRARLMRAPVVCACQDPEQVRAHEVQAEARRELRKKGREIQDALDAL